MILYFCMDALKPNVDACITKRNFLYKLADILNRLLMILLLHYCWGGSRSKGYGEDDEAYQVLQGFHSDIIDFDDDEFSLK